MDNNEYIRRGDDILARSRDTDDPELKKRLHDEFMALSDDYFSGKDDVPTVEDD